MNAWAEAEARRLVRTALEEEERRTQDRRATARGGRRLADVVAPEPARLYRVVSGKCAGQVVSEDETCPCERCDASGEVVVQVAERSWSSPAEHEAVPCPDCDGECRVLGYPSVGSPIRVELVEGGAR